MVVMKEVLGDPSRLKLGGERKDLTVLFSDICGFTAFCEKRTPEEIISVLNEIMDRMTDVIMRHGGTLDKYVGDEIVAFFGAPSSEQQQDHAQRAAECALDMVEEMKELHREWEVRGIPRLSMGIGINSGDMIVGNMGSSGIMDYTVVGSEVNLGARLESLTRQYGVTIIISEETRRRLSEAFYVKDLGKTKVKGLDREVAIYELVSTNRSPAEP